MNEIIGPKINNYLKIIYHPSIRYMLKVPQNHPLQLSLSHSPFFSPNTSDLK